MRTWDFLIRVAYIKVVDMHRRLRHSAFMRSDVFVAERPTMTRIFGTYLIPILLSLATAPSPFPNRAYAADERPVIVPVRFFRVSDDDGKRESTVDVDALRRQVDFMTKAFEPAHARFTFDAVHDLVPLKSTIVNNMLGADDANWVKAKREGNRIAAGSHGKLVVFLRHGPGAQPAGGSFSWFDYNFIAFAAGTDRYWNLAHEAAHYFGLAHPHAAPEFKTVKEAEAFFVKHGKRPEIFDGDGLKDTPPCPGIVALYDGNERFVTLAGHRFTILRGNVVSYYHYPKPEGDLAAGTMTQEQLARVRWFLAMRVKHGMAMPNNTLIANPIEAVSLRSRENGQMRSGAATDGRFLQGGLERQAAALRQGRGERPGYPGTARTSVRTPNSRGGSHLRPRLRQTPFLARRTPSATNVRRLRPVGDPKWADRAGRFRSACWCPSVHSKNRRQGPSIERSLVWLGLLATFGRSLARTSPNPIQILPSFG